MARICSNTATQLFNLYGPAECTINSHGRRITVEDGGGERIPIGVALPNTTGYVVDSFGMPVPVGVAGELYLGGPKVGRGYIGRPDLTEKSFVHVRSLPDAGRLYKTGDRVKWLPDGSVDFLGRVDFQVKLNGQRLETGEIEALLRQAEGVGDALVVLWTSSDNRPRLVGYVVGANADEASLREICSKALPGYMVPSVFMPLPEWPLNANGKIDRKRLPAPTLDDEAATDDGSSMDSVERGIAEAFKQVLHLQHLLPS